MELIHEEREGFFYTLHFAQKDDNQLQKMTVKFESGWSLLDKNEGMSFYKIGEERDFPYELNKDFKSIPLHIPDSSGRDVFKACYDYLVNETSAPVHISFTNHPGYPITLLTYNAYVMDKRDVLTIAHDIMAAIKLAVITEEELKEQSEPASDTDDTDEDIIVNYEEDPELKALMKQPVKTEILPLEGGE
ncbi:hypothetical protein [Priestia megaterium]|uniref:hypothetical protein n=1 Tax=Priestia megaterium TaxID=1404 RepID=UPI000BFB1D8F|nr:hypothetical protein [Priestia megaterium]PGQ88215.1 hypothetical protein COA18_04630 [Priestia megaterium]